MTLFWMNWSHVVRIWFDNLILLLIYILLWFEAILLICRIANFLSDPRMCARFCWSVCVKTQINKSKKKMHVWVVINLAGFKNQHTREKNVIPKIKFLQKIDQCTKIIRKEKQTFIRFFFVVGEFGKTNTIKRFVYSAMLPFLQ